MFFALVIEPDQSGPRAWHGSGDRVLMKPSYKLLNHLYTAVLAVNGVKVVANLRCGGPSSEEYLSAIPQGVMCASGFLGCGNVSEQSDLGYISKTMRVLPSKLILYGKRDRIAETQLDTCGIPWRRYEYVRSRNLRKKPHRPRPCPTPR